MQKTIDRRYWLITINNPEDTFEATMQNLQPKWAIGQKEQGTQNGTVHYQALLYFPDRLKNSYWEGKKCFAKAIPAQDCKQTIAYCTKEDTRLDGPYRYGPVPSYDTVSKAGKRSNEDATTALALCKTGRWYDVEPSLLIKHAKNLQNLSSFFSTPLETEYCRGVWIYGEPSTGKSFFVRQWCRNYTNFFVPTDETTVGNSNNLYDKAQNKWFDGYANQDYILLDDFDPMGECLKHLFKRWFDCYKVTGEIKGSHVQLRHLLFYITSNWHPNDVFTDPKYLKAITQRCQIIHFPEFAKPSAFPDPNPKPRGAHLITSENSEYEIQLYKFIS